MNPERNSVNLPEDDDSGRALAKDLESLISDKDKALDMAHAEKPFRDVQIEHKDRLTEQDQNTLDVAANLAAEKAGAEYDASKSELSESEKLIVKEAREQYKTLFLSDTQLEMMAGRTSVAGDMSPEAGKQAMQRAQQALDILIESRLQEILDSDKSDREKHQQATKLQWAQMAAKQRLGIQHSSIAHLEELPETISEKARYFPSASLSEANLEEILSGRLVADLALGHTQDSLIAIEQIAKARGVDFDDVYPIYGLVLESASSGYNQQQRDGLDKQMRQRGYIRNGLKYQKLSG